MTKAVLFDFDLTLADTLDMWQKVLKHLNSKGINTDGIHKKENWGNTHETFARMMSDMNDNKFAPSEISKLCLDYIKNDYGHLEIRAKPFLNKMKKKGLKIGIITGNNQVIMDIFVKKNPDIEFDTVLTADDLGPGETKADQLKQLMREWCLKTDEIMYVGDHPKDITAAKEAGVVSVAITSQLHSSDELQDYEPDYLIHRLEDIKDII